MTASTPIKVCGLDGIRDTGMPPPPQAIGRTSGAFSRIVLIASICRILRVVLCREYYFVLHCIYICMICSSPFVAFIVCNFIPI